MAKIENYDTGGPGEVVFYAHAAESMRSYLGLSKFHARADCSALARRGPRGVTVIQDRVSEISPARRCKVCNKPPAA